MKSGFFQSIRSPILTFFLVFGIAIGIRYFFLVDLAEPLRSLLFKSILLILFVGLTIKAGVLHRRLFRLTFSLSKKDLLLLFAVSVLFLLNNFFVKNTGTFNYGSWGSPSFMLAIFSISISSIGEEFMYRGFLQPTINQATAKQNGVLSRGNIVASIIMLITHFGFFSIMPLQQAFPALLLVLLFSLCAGYYRDQYQSLLLPILFHLLMNYIHVVVQVV